MPKKAAAVEFKVGELVVYPAQGVTIITAVESREIEGIQHVFYVLKVRGSEKKILVPIGKEAHVGMRHIMAPSVLKQVFGVLAERDLIFEQETWNRRSRRYMEKICSGDPMQLAEVVRDFSVAKGRKVLSFGEKKMLELARNLLAQELSVALNKPEANIIQTIDTAFEDIVPFGAE